MPDAPEPTPWPSSAGLIGAGAAVAGAAAIAGVLGQPTLALFALVGGLVALTTWTVGVASAWQRRRRGRRQHAAALERFDVEHRAAVAAARADHVADHPAVTDVLGELERIGERLDRGDDEIGTAIWSRSPGSAAAPSAPQCAAIATVGFGDVDLELGGAEHHRAGDLALPVRVAPGSLTAVCGPGAVALGRSIIVQLATALGPADLAVAVVTRTPDRWEWMRWLPHGLGRQDRACVIVPDDHDALDALDHHLTRSATTRFAATGSDAWSATDTTDHPAPVSRTGDSPARPLTVVVTDDLEALTVKTGRLRRIIDRHAVAVVALSERSGVAPVGATTTVELGALGTVTVTAIDVDSRSPFEASQARRRGRAGGISTATATCAARVLASLVDPEADGGDAQVPGALTLTDLLGPEALTVDAVLTRWAPGAHVPPPAAPLGRAGGGRVDIDLSADGPHGLIAGTTGSGKSELLQTLVISLAVANRPDAMTFVLVDYKGGATFKDCVDLPHTVGMVTDLDDAPRRAGAGVSLDAELHRREQLLRTLRC